MRDDTLEENDLVKEAVRRLPDRVYDERMYRISRALNLSNQKTVLPKTEWTKFEDVSQGQTLVAFVVGGGHRGGL